MVTTMNDGNGDPGMPLVPVSWGELIDKITILEIKIGNLHSTTARLNAQRELELLSERLVGPASQRPDIQDLRRRLTIVNRRLWHVEDRLRNAEARKSFGCKFVQLARSVYIRNDQRAALKREINLLLSSQLIEEKSYGFAKLPAQGQ